METENLLANEPDFGPWVRHLLTHSLAARTLLAWVLALAGAITGWALWRLWAGADGVEVAVAWGSYLVSAAGLWVATLVEVFEVDSGARSEYDDVITVRTWEPGAPRGKMAWALLFVAAQAQLFAFLLYGCRGHLPLFLPPLGGVGLLLAYLFFTFAVNEGARFDEAMDS